MTGIDSDANPNQTAFADYIGQKSVDNAKIEHKKGVKSSEYVYAPREIQKRQFSSDTEHREARGLMTIESSSSNDTKLTKEMVKMIQFIEEMIQHPNNMTRNQIFSFLKTHKNKGTNDINIAFDIVFRKQPKLKEQCKLNETLSKNKKSKGLTNSDNNTTIKSVNNNEDTNNNSNNNNNDDRVIGLEHSDDDDNNDDSDGDDTDGDIDKLLAPGLILTLNNDGNSNSKKSNGMNKVDDDDLLIELEFQNQLLKQKLSKLKSFDIEAQKSNNNNKSPHKKRANTLTVISPSAKKMKTIRKRKDTRVFEEMTYDWDKTLSRSQYQQYRELTQHVRAAKASIIDRRELGLGMNNDLINGNDIPNNVVNTIPNKNMMISINENSETNDNMDRELQEKYKKQLEKRKRIFQNRYKNRKSRTVSKQDNIKIKKRKPKKKQKQSMERLGDTLEDVEALGIDNNDAEPDTNIDVIPPNDVDSDRDDIKENDTNNNMDTTNDENTPNNDIVDDTDSSDDDNKDEKTNEDNNGSSNNNNDNNDDTDDSDGSDNDNDNRNSGQDTSEVKKAEELSRSRQDAYLNALYNGQGRNSLKVKTHNEHRQSLQVIRNYKGNSKYKDLIRLYKEQHKMKKDLDRLRQKARKLNPAPPKPNDWKPNGKTLKILEYLKYTFYEKSSYYGVAHFGPNGDMGIDMTTKTSPNDDGYFKFERKLGKSETVFGEARVWADLHWTGIKYVECVRFEYKDTYNDITTKIEFNSIENELDYKHSFYAGKIMRFPSDMNPNDDETKLIMHIGFFDFICFSTRRRNIRRPSFTGATDIFGNDTDNDNDTNEPKWMKRVSSYGKKELNYDINNKPSRKITNNTKIIKIN